MMWWDDCIQWTWEEWGWDGTMLSFAWRDEQNHKRKLGHDSHCHAWDMNWTHPKICYKHYHLSELAWCDTPQYSLFEDLLCWSCVCYRLFTFIDSLLWSVIHKEEGMHMIPYIFLHYTSLIMMIWYTYKVAKGCSSLRARPGLTNI